MISARLLGLAPLLFAACGGQPTNSQYIAGFNPPPANMGEMTILSPVIDVIEPGADVTLCTYLDQYLPETLDITYFRTYQSAAGHHVMVGTVHRKQTPGSHPCTEDDMVNMATFLGGGGKEGVSNFKGVADGLAFRAAGGAQIMMQTHWINASSKSVQGQAVVYATAKPMSPSVTPVDQFLADPSSFTIPAGKTAQVSSTCTFKTDMSFFMYAGHMHEWGKHIDLELVATDGTAKNIYAQDWQSDYMTNPPENAFTKEQPFVVHAGEGIRVTCQWDNTMGAKDIGFPKEMCYFVGYYFPGNGLLDCADGVWPGK